MNEWNKKYVFRLNTSSANPFDSFISYCMEGNWCGKTSCPHHPKYIVFIDKVHHWEQLKGTEECMIKNGE